MPAATYSVGFAKNYASAVGLDKAEIAEQLRAEMGGSRAPMATMSEVYEAADPARTMPKGLVFGALALVLIAVLGGVNPYGGYGRVVGVVLAIAAVLGVIGKNKLAPATPADEEKAS